MLEARDRRLARAGAKGGDVRVSLAWHTRDDLDCRPFMETAPHDWTPDAAPDAYLRGDDFFSTSRHARYPANAPYKCLD